MSGHVEIVVTRIKRVPSDPQFDKQKVFSFTKDTCIQRHELVF